MSKVVVIGGGAAGMMAAIQASSKGHNVILVEKNEKLGKKIYITGKGRCNITNASDMDVVFQNVVTNSKFLYGAFYSYTNEDIISLLEEQGCKVKVERGNRVFPVSDHSSDVIAALERKLKRLGVKILFRTEVTDLVIKEQKFCGVRLSDASILSADACVVATGGLSYPVTGSTGDGYRFAKKLGHHIKPCSPALVSLFTKEDTKPLMGLSLKNIGVRMVIDRIKQEALQDVEVQKKVKKIKPGKEIYAAFGEMLFTHKGVSGPVILSASSILIPYIKFADIKLYIDLKPALTQEQLDARVLRDFEEQKNKQFKNSLDQLLPQKLIEPIIMLSGIPKEKQVNSITKEERHKLVETIKNLPFLISQLGGYNEAVITQGGIDVKEIDASTMQSKLCEGVYFAGEVLDVDALTGGYNLQIAWSTGAVAGRSIL